MSLETSQNLFASGSTSNKEVTIIGAGLAGSEAAWQLVKRGIKVRLCEMRPKTMTKAHSSEQCAELVCSNSFRGASLTQAVGLLKEELRLLDSLIMAAADETQVPAGGALAVDRERFSALVSERVRNHPLITYHVGEVLEVPPFSVDSPVIIATGPLTSKPLFDSVAELLGMQHLAFFDAISPIITIDSIDQTVMFRQSRYDKGEGDDYLNIPLNEEEYHRFVADVDAGEKYGGHEEVEADDISGLRPFEGCMPIEEMVARGKDTLRFGPMKPVGLTDPRTGKRPYAVIQLRQDNREGTLWSLVGFQTRLKHGDQQRILRSLPGMSEAEFVRLGSVHRNSFIESPRCLDASLQARNHPGLFFAGQVTGVEGYVESTAAGLAAALSVASLLHTGQPVIMPKRTATGALMHYVSDPERKFFQPMNVSFGLMPSYFEEPRGKDGKNAHRQRVADKALDEMRSFCQGGLCRLAPTQMGLAEVIG